MHIARFAAAFVALTLLAACGGGSAPSPDLPATQATPEAESPAIAWGVAGVIPPHSPSPASSDFERLFASYSETGTLAGVYVNWADSPAEEGKVPKSITAVSQALKPRGVQLVVALGTARDGGATVTPTVDWADAAQRGRFMETVRAVAGAIHPPYLAIGVEVNRLWAADAAAFDAFVDGYREAYTVAKQASPSTNVFTVFQLEMLNGDAFLAGGADTRDPQWQLLDRFAGHLDVVGLTSYPFFDYETPDSLPADYYRSAAARAGRPLVLTELGWPSKPLRTAPDSGYGGTSEEQAAFIQRLPVLFEGGEIAAALWAFPFDPGPGVPPPFESVALRENDGTAKPAFAAWQFIIKGK